MEVKERSRDAVWAHSSGAQPTALSLAQQSALAGRLPPLLPLLFPPLLDVVSCCCSLLQLVEVGLWSAEAKGWCRCLSSLAYLPSPCLRILALI